MKDTVNNDLLKNCESTEDDLSRKKIKNKSQKNKKNNIKKVKKKKLLKICAQLSRNALNNLKKNTKAKKCLTSSEPLFVGIKCTVVTADMLSCDMYWY